MNIVRQIMVYLNIT